MKNKNLTLIILAAGIGTRYGGLKQLDSVTKSGETILDFSILPQIGRLVEVDFIECDGKMFARKIKIHAVGSDALDDGPYIFWSTPKSSQ